MKNPQIISKKAKEIVIIDEDVILNYLHEKVSSAIFYVQF